MQYRGHIYIIKVYIFNIGWRPLLTRTYILPQTKEMDNYILIYIKMDLYQENLPLHIFGRNLYGFLIKLS